MRNMLMSVLFNAAFAESENTATSILAGMSSV